MPLRPQVCSGLAGVIEATKRFGGPPKAIAGKTPEGRTSLHSGNAKSEISLYELVGLRRSGDGQFGSVSAFVLVLNA